MVRQPTHWKVRMAQAAVALETTPEAVEQVVLDRLKLNTAADLDADAFTFEKLAAAFKSASVAQTRRAYAALHMLT